MREAEGSGAHVGLVGQRIRLLCSNSPQLDASPADSGPVCPSSDHGASRDAYNASRPPAASAPRVLRQTLKPSSRRHALCASISAAQYACSSPAREVSGCWGRR
eukprot:364347-Chlamydomonas_euryale.AAC.12